MFFSEQCYLRLQLIELRSDIIVFISNERTQVSFVVFLGLVFCQRRLTTDRYCTEQWPHTDHIDRYCSWHVIRQRRITVLHGRCVLVTRRLVFMIRQAILTTGHPILHSVMGLCRLLTGRLFPLLSSELYPLRLDQCYFTYENNLSFSSVLVE